MSHDMETSTIRAVALALDAANLRHQAIASNIANADTAGYRPLRVSFEQHLDALRAALQGSRPLDQSLLETARPRIERETASSVSGSSAVALDEQVGKLTENAVHYQALLRALNKQFSILSAAINDGKR